MTKTLVLSLGGVGALSIAGPTTVGVPIIAPGQTLASGYYTDLITGIKYFYDAGREQWYYYSAGLYYPLAIPWMPSPSAKLDLAAGDTIAIVLGFNYIGPAVTRTFYAALGTNKTSGIFDEWTEIIGDEKWWVQVDVDITKADVLTPKTQYIYLPIPTHTSIFSSHYGEDAALYCKILDGITLIRGVNCTYYYYDVAHVLALEGEFSGLTIDKFSVV